MEIDICPQDSLSMLEKEVLPDVPENALEINMRIATERMQLESQV